MLGFLAETAIHYGAGRSAGIVDLPIVREATTDYPFLAGSGLKGALRDRANSLGCGNVDELFGKPDAAGKLLVSDARLLLLPVRCLTGAYRWVTCPLLLERYGRDIKRCGLQTTLPNVTNPKNGEALGPEDQQGNLLYLEERQFTITGKCEDGIHEAVKVLIQHEQTRERLAAQILILSNDDFAWFCRFSIPIQTRNFLEDETKRSKNLWSEEYLPPDTLLYALAMGRDETTLQGALAKLSFESDPYLQIGGNETVGHGWVVVAIPRAIPQEGAS